MSLSCNYRIQKIGKNKNGGRELKLDALIQTYLFIDNVKVFLENQRIKVHTQKRVTFFAPSSSFIFDTILAESTLSPWKRLLWSTLDAFCNFSFPISAHTPACIPMCLYPVPAVSLAASSKGRWLWHSQFVSTSCVSNSTGSTLSLFRSEMSLTVSSGGGAFGGERMLLYSRLFQISALFITQSMNQTLI